MNRNVDMKQTEEREKDRMKQPHRNMTGRGHGEEKREKDSLAIASTNSAIWVTVKFLTVISTQDFFSITCNGTGPESKYPRQHHSQVRSGPLTCFRRTFRCASILSFRRSGHDVIRCLSKQKLNCKSPERNRM